MAQDQPTGIGRYLRELVSALAAVSTNEDFLLVSTPEAAAANWAPRSANIHILPWSRPVVHAAWSLGTGPQLERSIGSVDVTHLIQPFPPIRTESAQLVTVHDLFPLDHPDWYPRSERWTFRRSIGLALRRARRVVVPSTYVAERLASTFGVSSGRVDVVPHGITGLFARPRPQQLIETNCARFGIERGQFVVCLGAIAVRKNTVTLIRAMDMLPGKTVPLVIVGAEGHQADRVRTTIRRHAGDKQIILTGYLSDDDTAALVQAAAVLVHPALAEGFGLVPLEAMAAGTPVIAAASSSIPEVVGGACMLVDEPMDPHAWSVALAGLLDNPDERAALARAGRERASAFSWERAARTMLQIYRDIARV